MPTRALPASRRCRDQLDDAVAVARIERGGRLVEQQDRVIDDQRARDVDPLLLAAREGGRRQLPQALRDVEQGEQELGAIARLGRVGAQPQQGLGHDVDGGDARDHAQELADEAHGAAAHVEHGARLGVDKLGPGVVVMDADRARVGAVVAVERAQQRALAGARRADQGQALAGRDGERHVAQHRQSEVAVGMDDEGLGEAGDLEDGAVMLFEEGMRHHHTGKIEATSICV